MKTSREPGNEGVMMIIVIFTIGHEWHRQAETSSFSFRNIGSVYAELKESEHLLLFRTTSSSKPIRHVKPFKNGFFT